MNHFIVPVLILFSIFCVILFLLLLAIYKKEIHYWIFSYIMRGFIRLFETKSQKTIHIMLCFVDHFEPGNGNATPEKQRRRVAEWVERYPSLAERHKDSDGVCPQHTFFYPPHYDTDDHLTRLVDLCGRGFGEIEMHLHHDRMSPWPDDEESFRNKLLNCIESFSRYGIFCLPDGRKTYAFIHGDWALANSLRDDAHCGVNDELSILEQTGCYADFTFPVSNEAQPKLANCIFYGKSNPNHPKGYNRKPIPVRVGRTESSGLMLIQGIIGLRWKSRIHFLKPSIEQSNISRTDVPFPQRIDYWIRNGIRLHKKPNWVFIKIHGHGAIAKREDREVLLGREIDGMFSYLETRYNDGENYALHYVSAREMYNIIKAAEEGKDGNPNSYRDYRIPRYVYLRQKASK